jgi:hypothetical protein
MLDYSLLTKDFNYKFGDFICNYEIYDNEIILFNCGKEFARIPYTEENEKDVLNVMKEQIRSLLKIKDDVLKNMKSYDFKVEIYTFFTISWLILSIICFLKKNNSIGIYLGIAALGNTLLTIGNNLKLKLNDNILDDLEKHELFLEYEVEINRYIKDNNVLQDFRQSNTININDIHRLDYEDVEHLVEIARDYQYKVK